MKGMAIFQKDRYETMKELRAALFSAPATNTDLTDSYSAQVSVYDVQAPKNSENLSERENITWNNSAAVQTSPTRKNVWDELYGNNMEAAEIEKNSNRKSSLKSKAVESIKNSLAQKYESLTGFSTEDIRENIGYTSVEPASSGNTNIWDAAYGSKEAIRGNLIPKLKSEPQKGTQLRKAAEELREESKGKNIWDEIYGKRG